METINLGRVAFVYKGDYSAVTTYNKMDVVFDGESSFVSQIDNNVGNPLVNGLNWKYLSRGNNLELQEAKQDIATLETNLNTKTLSFKGSASDLYSVSEIGIYSVSPTSLNLPSDWASYGFMIVYHSNFRMLYRTNTDKVYVKYEVGGWIDYKESTKTYVSGFLSNTLIGSMSDVIDIINSGFKNDIYSYDGTEIDTDVSTIGALISSSTGKIVVYSNNDWVVRKYNIVEGDVFRIVASSKFGNTLFSVFNSSNTLLYKETALSGGVATTVEKIYIAPYQASYILVQDITSTRGYISTIQLKYKEFKKWIGKKWAAIGDSLTEDNIRTTMHYHDYINVDTSISVINLGKSGTGYAKSYNTYLPFYQRVDTIPADADVITIFGSGNDGSIPLGTETDVTTDTVGGCMNRTFDLIFESFPTKPIGVITPTPWIGSEPNEGESTMSKYCNLLINICKNRGIPYLDLYHCSNLHPSNRNFRVLCYSKDGTYSNSTEGTINTIQVTSENIDTINSFLASGSAPVSIGDWVFPDLNGVHPNELGHKIIYPRIKAFLDELI